jgi:hypothetical protein
MMRNLSNNQIIVALMSRNKKRINQIQQEIEFLTKMAINMNQKRKNMTLIRPLCHQRNKNRLQRKRRKQTQESSKTTVKPTSEPKTWRTTFITPTRSPGSVRRSTGTHMSTTSGSTFGKVLTEGSETSWVLYRRQCGKQTFTTYSLMISVRLRSMRLIWLRET